MRTRVKQQPSYHWLDAVAKLTRQMGCSQTHTHTQLNFCSKPVSTKVNASSHPRKDLSAIFSSTLFANILSGLQQNRSCGSIHASLFSVGKTPFSLHFLLLDLLRAARRCFLKLNLASYLLPLLYRKLIDYGIPWKIKTN